MAGNIEFEDQVDLDYETFSEEDDNVEEHMEDEETAQGDEKNGGEEQDHIGSTDSRKSRSVGTDGNTSGSESVEYEEKPGASIEEDKMGIRAKLLAIPPSGSEIFIGGLSQDISEDDLRKVCEPLGEIFKIRVAKNWVTGESKGFAFVAFKTKDVVQKAIEVLHGKELKGRTLRCSHSDAKHTLLIVNVPKSWRDDDLKKVIQDNGPGAETIELVKDPQYPGQNQGFAFVGYYNYACADYSRKKMSNIDPNLSHNTLLTATWADPKIIPDYLAAAQVKALYVKNIPENTSTEQLKELFQCHGEVTKVVMPPAKFGGKRDFGFVSYAERSSALRAIKDKETYKMNGQVLEVVLAKPQTEKKIDRTNPRQMWGHMAHGGYAGMPMKAYASNVAGYDTAAGFQQQPMIYGRGPIPEGMQMVPVVLSDGRIGYILQEPRVQFPQVMPQRYDRGKNAPGKHSRNGYTYRSKRYQPYEKSGTSKN